MLLPDGFIWEEITVTDDSNKELPSIKEQGKNLSKFTFEVVKNVIDVSSDVVVIWDRRLGLVPVSVLWINGSVWYKIIG